VRPQNGPEGEEREQNNEERNAAHANDNLEVNPAILASGSNCNENNLPLQNETLSSNALIRPSKSIREHDEERNPTHEKNKHEDDPDFLIPGSSVGRKLTYIAWNESSNEQNNNKNTS